MSNDKKTMEDVRNLIVCDTQFGWTGSTTLRLQQMLALQERGWLTEGAENNEFDLTDAGRDVVARALQSAVQPTLADVQPGGRVRLGDGLPPCPFCGHSDFDQWPCEYIDASGANVVRCAHCHVAAPMKVWHDLSAQPSPGGQGDAELRKAIADVVSESRTVAHVAAMGNQTDDAQRCLDAAQQRLEAALAARQPVYVQGSDELRARTEGERAAYMEGLEEGKKIAARQPVGALPQGCDACDQTGIRQNDEGRNICCPDCDLGSACAGDTRQPVGRSFQAGVAEWMGRCFLPSLYSNMTERGDRLLEEVLELLQARGYDSARVPTLVDYVFGRPVGEPAQEVGGVMVTLAGYCWVAGLDMHAAGDAELARINQPKVMANIRAKQEAKNALHFDTPLPGDAGAAIEEWPREGDLVRYGDGCSSLAIRLGPHAGGWHGYQCCGGYTFFTKAYRPSRADMDTWLDCAKYRDERTKEADNRVAHEMYLLDSQAVQS